MASWWQGIDVMGGRGAGSYTRGIGSIGRALSPHTSYDHHFRLLGLLRLNSASTEVSRIFSFMGPGFHP